MNHCINKNVVKDSKILYPSRHPNALFVIYHGVIEMVKYREISDED